jgi:hypothetical protein
MDLVGKPISKPGSYSVPEIGALEMQIEYLFTLRPVRLQGLRPGSRAGISGTKQPRGAGGALEALHCPLRLREH